MLDAGRVWGCAMTERGARYLNVGSGPRLIEPPPVFADMAGVRFDADP